MTSEPRAPQHDAQNDAQNEAQHAPQHDAPQHDAAASEAEKTLASTGEPLEEFEQRTAKVMADARKQVDRARETLHDQILSEPRGSRELDSEAEQANSEAEESGPEKDDTRGAWPNWR